MSCATVLDLIETIASGELVPDQATSAHLASCERCRAALEHARGIERLLRERQAPGAPPDFTTRTLARIRRERWRRDQVIDMVFNAVVVALVVGAILGGWLLLSQSGLVTITDDAVGLIQSRVVSIAEQIAPSVPLYAGAAALLAGAVALWWWAERDEALR